MTTKRLFILLLVVLGGLSSVAFLPKQLGYQPVGINLDLPDYLGEWWDWKGRDQEVTEKEHIVLGQDTEFARKLYRKSDGTQSFLVSIVLAGQDMMTGIHRPERCLNAQGWTVGADTQRFVDVPGCGLLRASRLMLTKKEIRGDEVIPIRSMCYYWFVGYKQLAATHGERVWVDSCDRMLQGVNQRWAMIMVTSTESTHNDAETEAMLQDVVKLLSPKILKPGLKM